MHEYKICVCNTSTATHIPSQQMIKHCMHDSHIAITDMPDQLVAQVGSVSQISALQDVHNNSTEMEVQIKSPVTKIFTLRFFITHM